LPRKPTRRAAKILLSSLACRAARFIVAENKEFEQAEMPVGKDAEGNVVNKPFEGEYHYWDMGTREGMSEIQIFRNFENALKQSGFTIVYESSPTEITAHKGRHVVHAGKQGLVLLPDDPDGLRK